MDDLLFSLNATVPLFLVMLVGYALRLCGVASKEFGVAANTLVFKVTLPVLLFQQMRNVNLRTDFDARYIGFCALATLISICGIWVLARRFVRDKKSVGAFVQGSFRSSAAILGLALLQNMYGAAPMGGMMILGSVPLYNVFAVLVLTVEGPNAAEKSLRETLATAAKGIVTNPLILGIVAGLLASAVQLPLPTMLDKTLSSISSVTAPLALLSIGIGFEPKQAFGKLKLTSISSAIKLLILPAIFLPIAAKVGFQGEQFMGILVMLGLPSAATCYVMAHAMGGDETLAGGTVMLTTMLSAVTLTLWVFVWRSLGVV